MSVLAARRNALLIRNRSRQSLSSRHHAAAIAANHQYLNTTDPNISSISSAPLSKREECEKNCTRNFTARASAGCMRKCAMQYKIVLVPNRTNSASARNTSNIDSITISVNSSKVRINGDKESNTIADELLETEESQSTGLYFVPNSAADAGGTSKSVPMKYAPNNVSPSVSDTKEHQNNTTTTISAQLYKNNSYKNNVIENEVRQSSTEKIYLKFLRTTFDTRHKRVDPAIAVAMVAKAKQRSSTTTIAPTTAAPLITEKSVEDSELAPYLLFGQKLTGSKTIDLRAQKLIENSMVTKPSRAKISSGEEVAVEAAPPSKAPERSNKFRRFNPHTRNIVALSRKYGGTIPKSVWEQAGNNSALNRTADAVVSAKPPLSHDNEEAFKLPDDLKILNLTMEAANETAVDLTNDNTATTMEPLLIQVPEIASRFGDEVLPVSKSEPTETTPFEVARVTRQPIELPSPPPAATVTHKINYAVNRHQPEETPNLIVFLPPPQNVTLQTQITEKPDNEPQSKNRQPTEEVVTPNTVTPFTRTTVSSSIRSTVNPVTQNNTVNGIEVVKKSSVPQQPIAAGVTTPSPDVTFAIFKETMLTAPSIVTAQTTVSPTQTTSTTVQATTTAGTTTPDISPPLTYPNATTTTVFTLSSIFPNFSGIKQNVPALPDMSTIFGTGVNSSKNPTTIMMDGSILLTPNNDVTIEMHRMNMATYVLAGLGMLPIVLIVLYVIKSIMFRRHTKTGGELERYIADGGHKPISPVVRLEDSSGQSSYSGDESIVNEQNFNRNYLKFKSLLGEGNFGQVWKAEADDLVGHLGTTRIVAVKTERGGGGGGNLCGGLKDEAEIMKKLGSHVNVVTLLGACCEKGLSVEALENRV